MVWVVTFHYESGFCCIHLLLHISSACLAAVMLNRRKKESLKATRMNLYDTTLNTDFSALQEYYKKISMHSTSPNGISVYSF